MKNKFKFLFLIFFIGVYAFSQEERVSNYSSDIFNSEQDALNILSNINLSQINDEDSRLTNQENSVIIQQIGYYNTVNSQTVSQSSQLELIQNGDFNNIDLMVNAPNIYARVLQNGNDNNVMENIYYSNLDVKLNAIQNGNDLSVNIIGINSLSNKLQIIQEGSFKTLTVISN